MRSKDKITPLRGDRSRRSIAAIDRGDRPRLGQQPPTAASSQLATPSAHGAGCALHATISRGSYASKCIRRGGGQSYYATLSALARTRAPLAAASEQWHSAEARTQNRPPRHRPGSIGLWVGMRDVAGLGSCATNIDRVSPATIVGPRLAFKFVGSGIDATTSHRIENGETTSAQG